MKNIESASKIYMPDIDGLRGIAVLSVVFYHTEVPLFTGGFVGVDVFFVISGFLITRIILTELVIGSFSFRDFYLRRIRRILPALLPVIMFCIMIGWQIFLPKHFQELGGAITAQQVFLSNIYFWLQTGYFQEPAQAMPLLHTWSLAIEEQFYIVLPPALYVVVRVIKKHWVLHLLILGILFSFSISFWGTYFKPSATFYWAPTRAWELLMGSVIAYIQLNRRGGLCLAPWLGEVAGFLGLSFILIAIFAYSKSTIFPTPSALLPCIGSVLILISGANQTLITKFLSIRPLVWIGVISYSLYLWHWPIYVFYSYDSYSALQGIDVAIIILTAMVISYISYVFVETPFRRRRALSNNFRLLLSTLSTSFLAIAAGLLIYINHGYPTRFSGDALAYASGSYDVNRPNICQKIESSDFEAFELCRVGPVQNEHPKILLWGNSHGGSLMPLMENLSMKYGVEVWRGGGACIYLGDQTYYSNAIAYGNSAHCEKSRSSVFKAVELGKIKHILFVSRWSSETEFPERGTEEFVTRNFSTEELLLLREAFVKGINSSLTNLEQYKIDVSIMKQVPEHNFHVPKKLTQTAKNGGDISRVGRPISEHFERTKFSNSYFDTLTQNGTRILDPTNLFCSENQFCIVAHGKRALYYDNDHLTVAGSMFLKPLYEHIFSSFKTEYIK